MKILKFSANWCAPCKVLANQLKDYDDHVIENYDFDKNPNEFMEYGVKKLPTLIIVSEDNQELDRSIGVKSLFEFKDWVKQYG